MRIHRVTIRSFRGVDERTVEFAEAGVTVVEGPNESGKTTITQALDLLLDYRDDSTAHVVRAAKPVHVDEGAAVEAELSAGPYRFTYAKRWHKDRSTTLTVTEPSPESLTGRAAHERVLAILEETVDLPLWRALRLQQGVALDQADLSGATSLAAALDAVAGAGIGGDRETTVYERVRAEHERYHTPTGRPNAALKAVAEAHDEALAETDRLSRELDAVDADVELVGRLESELAELRPQIAAARQQLRELEQTWQAMERRLEEVEQLRLAAELAAARQDGQVELLERRRGAISAADSSEQTFFALQQEREEAEPQLVAAEKALVEVRDLTTTLRDELTGLRRSLRQRSAALGAARDREQLSVLGSRLDRARAAEADLAAAEAILEEALVDPAVLTQIEDAAHDLLVAEAALEAQAPVLHISAFERLTVQTAQGPRILQRGEELERSVADSESLQLGDVAKVTVHAGAQAGERARRARQAELTLQELLDAAGVRDLAGARAAARRREEAIARRDRAAATVSEALGDETSEQLAGRISRMSRRLTEAEEITGETEDLRVELEDAEAAVEQRERQLAEAEALLVEVSERHERRLADVRILDARVADAIRLRDESVRLLEAARAARADEALEADAAEAASAQELAVQAYGQALRELESDDPEGVRVALADAQLLHDRLTARERAVEDELRDVRSRLEVRGEQGLHDRFAEAMRDLEHAKRERDAVEARAASARLLYERMTAHRDAARRAYAAPFRDKLERLGRIVFGERFAVELDEDLRIARRTLDGVTLDFDQLSSGAQEQLAVLARLACAAIIGRDGGVPLVLDDALGYADPARLERLGAALRVGARDCQVIVLTCVPDRYQAVTDATVVRLT